MFETSQKSTFCRALWQVKKLEGAKVVPSAQDFQYEIQLVEEHAPF